MVSVKEQTLVLYEINCYPNPAQDVIYIEDKKQIPFSAVLYDILGNDMGVKAISKGERLSLRTTGIRDGLYFIRISVKDQVVMKKVLIRH